MSRLSIDRLRLAGEQEERSTGGMTEVPVQRAVSRWILDRYSVKMATRRPHAYIFIPC